MATINTIQVYNLDGVSTDFPVSFDYLARKFVQVTLLGANRRPLVLVTEFVFTNSTTVRTLTAWGPAQGYQQIEIRRVTSATERLVTFADATILRAGDLNLAELQSMHIAEEARNSIADVLGLDDQGNLDAKFRRVVNLADPIGPRDAVNLQSMNTEYSTIKAAADNALTVAEGVDAKAQEALQGYADVRSAVGASLVGWHNTTVQEGLDILYRGAVNVHETRFAGGAKGDGVNDDSDAIQEAIDTGLTVNFQPRRRYRVTKTLRLRLATLSGQNYQSQALNLNGSLFEVIGANTFMLIEGWPYVPGTYFIVQGDGSRVAGTRGLAQDGIAVLGGYGHKIYGIDFRGFTSCVHLTVANVTHWNESTIVRGVRGSDFQYGIRTSSVGGDVSASFDQTHIEYCEFNCTRDGAVGFVIEGFHGRTTMIGCGVWLGEEGAVNTVGWKLNGQCSGSVMMGCWADGGATAENTIQFGPGYPNLSESNSSAAGAMSIIGTGVSGDIANYMKLPPGWQWKLKVTEATTVYGAHVHSDEVDGTGTTRTAASGSILTFSAIFYHPRGTTNTLYKRTVFLPFGARKLLNASIVPLARGSDNLARSAGSCGIFQEDYALGVPTSIEFFMIPTNLNGTGGGEGCFYRVSATLQMA